MKILQVNCVYGNGSTGKIVHDIHQELLGNGMESIVCYGRGEKTSESNVHKVCGELYSKLNNLFSRITGIMYGGCFFSTNKLIGIIKKERPDVVHLHCINGYFVNIYRLVKWLKKNGIKTVLTLHAEFMYTANCGHALECEKWKTGCGQCPHLKKETRSWFFDKTARSFEKMKRAFSGFDDNLIVTSVSPWLMERAKQSPILGDKAHFVVFNGVDTEIFSLTDTSDLRKKHGLRNEKIIFHATPSFSDDPNHFKGGYYVLKLAQMLKEDGVKIVVAGSCAEGLKVPENVILLGRLEDQRELAGYYAMADVTVLASKKETFSMVTAESLCCGTPVVGFRAGGPEQIAIEAYSDFVEYGDMDALCSGVRKMIARGLDAGRISQAAEQVYSKKMMAKAYIRIYSMMVGAI